MRHAAVIGGITQDIEFSHVPRRKRDAALRMQALDVQIIRQSSASTMLSKRGFTQNKI
jgi:hypothetical protein